MARYDVFAGRVEGSYLLNVQSDLLDHLKTRVVIPLLPIQAAPPAIRNLHPSSRSMAESCLWPPI